MWKGKCEKGNAKKNYYAKDIAETTLQDWDSRRILNQWILFISFRLWKGHCEKINAEAIFEKSQSAHPQSETHNCRRNELPQSVEMSLWKGKCKKGNAKKNYCAKNKYCVGHRMKNRGVTQRKTFPNEKKSNPRLWTPINQKTL